ncbi:UDP-N-acetylglucosamine--N-acetylmuramyl-(pentapeptide) pyrophosphoryl-undecaprenol N-acetylglucosamine transferase [Chitinispirillales bacterium ANBcel5]|uniref:UDP-N-acetylglucosamine--N-acetylmuramyl- (pentapeptide) pyrophosphoryl-undecaprenol N-acetylglucosamine transferase n=1 Tax=Cellulosispirillum alkaliphilum TaxID=3039283 RepID=UPI002A52F80A|nr:UDP-N-acetylglucosamine--N-acetylmuramyl-(pentapeptide) pyrophosphoryl-undecaprenol N-acetylglucosamine transferase [Chitinispirillales bacterium ANBcel5]
MKNKKTVNSNKVIFATAGLEERCIPAISVALELRRRSCNIVLSWIGSGRKREADFCKKHRISLFNFRKEKQYFKHSYLKFATEFFHYSKLLSREKPGAVFAFGGFETAPILAAARLKSVPYYLMENNSVADPVNRIFASGARRVFLGLPQSKNLNGETEVTGIPVKPVSGDYEKSYYPQGFDKNKKTILICCGEERVHDLNTSLIPIVKNWLKYGAQVVWQTGADDCNRIRDKFRLYPAAFVFSSLKDRYPYLAASRVVVSRSKADILAEISYFGLPSILTPLTKAQDNVQWVNAGIVRNQGWAFRYNHFKNSREIEEAAIRVLDDDQLFEKMSRKALDHAPLNAVNRITGVIAQELGIEA